MSDYIERGKLIGDILHALLVVPSEDFLLPPEKDILRMIKSEPAADVRPVVLCRDCRHRDPEDHKCDCGQLERAGCIFPVDDDYFCAYGERPNCGADMREES